jgi:hypothetical protein
MKNLHGTTSCSAKRDHLRCKALQQSLGSATLLVTANNATSTTDCLPNRHANLDLTGGKRCVSSLASLLEQLALSQRFFKSIYFEYFMMPGPYMLEAYSGMLDGCLDQLIADRYFRIGSSLILPNSTPLLSRLRGRTWTVDQVWLHFTEVNLTRDENALYAITEGLFQDSTPATEDAKVFRS